MRIPNGGIMFKLELRNIDGPFLDRFKGDLFKDFKNVLRIIKNKYGIKINVEDKLDKDLSWLKD